MTSHTKFRVSSEDDQGIDGTAYKALGGQEIDEEKLAAGEGRQERRQRAATDIYSSSSNSCDGSWFAW